MMRLFGAEKEEEEKMAAASSSSSHFPSWPPQQQQIFVRSVDGKTISIDIADPSCHRIADLKAELERRTGVSTDLQRLTFGLHPLSDDDDETTTLFDCGIGAEATLSLCVGLEGGAKKRKKKTYTKPKKQKHKKKKVKLSVLKFYKVDGSDKVTRLRKVCPSPTCGAGVFMALHQNRTYCGRCGLTYIMKQDEVK